MAVVDLFGPAAGNINTCGPFAISPTAGITAASATPRASSGGYYLHVDTTAGSGQFVKQFSPTTNKLVLVCAWRPGFNTGVGGFETRIMHIYDNTDTHYVELRCDGRAASEASSQRIKLKAYSGGTTDTQTHTTVPANGTWYVIDLSIDMSANPWSILWRMKPDGGSWVDGPPISLAVATQSLQYYTVGTAGASTGYIYDFQDLVYSTATTTYLDDHNVLPIKPNGNGTHLLDASPSVYFFEHDGATGTAIVTADTVSYTRLDDVPVSGSSDRVYITGTPANTRYLEWDFENTSEVPTAIRVVEAVQQDTTAGGSAYTSKITDDAGVSLTTVQSAVDPNSTTEVFKMAVVATKPSGGAWTSAALNALDYRYGYTADAVPVLRLNALMLEMAVPVVAGSTFVTQTFALPWELVGAANPNTLGSISTTSSVVRVWTAAQRNPTADDDSTTGVAVGDIWVYAGFVWWCTSAAQAAATWKPVS